MRTPDGPQEPTRPPEPDDGSSPPEAVGGHELPTPPPPSPIAFDELSRAAGLPTREQLEAAGLEPPSDDPTMPLIDLSFLNEAVPGVDSEPTGGLDLQSVTEFLLAEAAVDDPGDEERHEPLGESNRAENVAGSASQPSDEAELPAPAAGDGAGTVEPPPPPSGGSDVPEDPDEDPDESPSSVPENSSIDPERSGAPGFPDELAPHQLQPLDPAEVSPPATPSNGPSAPRGVQKEVTETLHEALQSEVVGLLGAVRDGLADEELRAAGGRLSDLAAAAANIVDEAVPIGDAENQLALMDLVERLKGVENAGNALQEEGDAQAARELLLKIVRGEYDISLREAPIPERREVDALTDQLGAVAVPDIPLVFEQPATLPTDPDAPVLGGDRRPMGTTVIFMDLARDSLNSDSFHDGRTPDPHIQSGSQFNTVQAHRFTGQEAAARSLRNELDERVRWVEKQRLLNLGYQATSSDDPEAIPFRDESLPPEAPPIFVKPAYVGQNENRLPVLADEQVADAYKRVLPELRELRSRTDEIVMGIAAPVTIEEIDVDLLEHARRSNEIMADAITEDHPDLLMGIGDKVLEEVHAGKLDADELRLAKPFLDTRYDAQLRQVERLLDAAVRESNQPPPKREAGESTTRQKFHAVAVKMERDLKLFADLYEEPESQRALALVNELKITIGERALATSFNDQEIDEASAILGDLRTLPFPAPEADENALSRLAHAARPAELTPDELAARPPRIGVPYVPPSVGSEPSVPIGLVVLDTVGAGDESATARAHGTLGHFFTQRGEEENAAVTEEETLVATVVDSEIDLHQDPPAIIQSAYGVVRRYREQLASQQLRDIRRKNTKASADDNGATGEAESFRENMMNASREALHALADLPDTQGGAGQAVELVAGLQRLSVRAGLRSRAANGVLREVTRGFSRAYELFDEPRAKSTDPRKAATRAAVRADQTVETMKEYAEALEKMITERLEDASNQALTAVEKARLLDSVNTWDVSLEQLQGRLSANRDLGAAEYDVASERVQEILRDLDGNGFSNNGSMEELGPEGLRKILERVRNARHYLPERPLGHNVNAVAVARHYLPDDPDTGHSALPSGPIPGGSPASAPERVPGTGSGSPPHMRGRGGRPMSPPDVRR
ncbi:MAG: hypothetical protein HOQ05_11140 [Corynebacteriales bacterium]|nr:hypothetical protein [Mycobacteriales bacterium]